ncbi:M15 family metallopeptidase [Psychrobacter aestuarii]|uniref:D-alanyl-D-alanine dipeptidase n=1 Tax=Psychrobacter aestuarii TaxID=556327 RepID=A0ABP3FAE7_9GAMM|nr:M15 family metallopeptidase [Psychrobacter aestuarii]
MFGHPIPKLPQHDWDGLDATHIVHADEPLQIIPTSDKLKSFPFYFAHDVKHALNLCVARQTVVQKLQQAAALLPAHIGIVVLDAWRPRAVQQALQDDIGHVVKQTYPELNEQEQQALLAQFVAPADSDFISPHLTGGSVDITLFDINSGEWLDMGAGFDEPTERSYTHFYEDQPESAACGNRRLLYWAMASVGFSNLPTEWWHFDYGNALWAHYANEQHALYGAIQWEGAAS